MSARMNPGRQLVLGIFIVGALSLLAYYTLFLKEFSLFHEQEQITITFDEARGLRAGDAVLVAGVRWGRVASVEYDSNAQIDQRITVTATLTQPVELREDGWFRIEDSTLLGGRVLSINPGTPGIATFPAGTLYHGEVDPVVGSVALCASRASKKQVVPYDGGRSLAGTAFASAPFPPVAESIDELASAMGCGRPTDERSEGAGTTEVWDGCDGSARVQFVTLAGAPHAWPRPPLYDATGQILAFFGIA